MIVVGMDAHVRNSFLHGTDAVGQVIRRGRCPNVFGAMAEWFAPLERRAKASDEAIRVVLESTTNSRAMRRLLLRYAEAAELEMNVDVLHARKLRIIAESVAKCDGLDAAVLNQLARSNLTLPTCYMPDDEVFALREHLRARSDLVRMRTMLKNRVHAILHRRGILAPDGLFTKAGRAFLAQRTLDEAGREILNHFLTAMDQMDQLIDESNTSLRALQRRPRWAKPAARLQTMPGIGLITSLMILAELGDWKRFRSRASVANYAGLVPVVRDSNTKHYRGGITHQGSCHLRAVLVEAAWVAVPRVPAYRDLFERVHNRKTKATAIVAVARRMLEDSWIMLIREEAFRYVDPPEVCPSAGETPCAGKIDEGRARPNVERAASSVAG